MISLNARFTIVALLLTCAGIFLETRQTKHRPATTVPLASLPLEFGNWRGVDIPIGAETLNALGRAETLQRTYRNRTVGEPQINVFVAYYPSQHEGESRHVSEECLIGSGWSIVDPGTTKVSMLGRKPFQASRYLIRRRGERQMVLFWFWGRGREIASTQLANLYLAYDMLSVNRSDDALIRINTPVLTQEEAGVAEQRLLSFAAQFAPLVDSYFPR